MEVAAALKIIVAVLVEVVVVVVEMLAVLAVLVDQAEQVLLLTRQLLIAFQ